MYPEEPTNASFHFISFRFVLLFLLSHTLSLSHSLRLSSILLFLVLNKTEYAQIYKLLKAMASAQKLHILRTVSHCIQFKTNTQQQQLNMGF